METSLHQEWRARQRVNWRAIWQTALCAGGILFLMSGGSPWTTAGTMNAVMGRDLPLGFFTLLTCHLLLSYGYVVVIAHVIYRLRLVPALLAGVATAMVLYGINFAVFHGLAIQMQSPEIRALLVHFSFGLLSAGIYKGASVPRPFRGGSDQVATATQIAVGSETYEDDPEPQPVAAGSKGR